MSKFNLGDKVFIDPSIKSRVNSKPVRATVTQILSGGVCIQINGMNGFYTISNSYVYKRMSIIGKTFKRNNLKLISRSRSNKLDIPCGETLQIRKHYKHPTMDISTYYTSRGFYIAPHRIRRYYEEV